MDSNDRCQRSGRRVAQTRFWGDADNKLPSTEQLYYRQVTEPPPDPRVRNPAVGPSVADLVRWALSEDYARIRGELLRR